MNRASASSSDIIDAKLEEHRISATMQCPSCGHKLERKPDWVGLPAGVKFDPTDQELIEHLEAQVKITEDSKSHPLIDEFIPTIEGDDGICYTHPEKLPGVTRDGLSKHFFHRPSKAYTTGTRKRRKIQTECDVQRGETRWHKTGKTRPVMVNGRQKGCKKILVLYTNFGKHRKPEKTNWVMHQYHLGELEEEKEGELVVSKIFYQTQPRQCNWSDRSSGATVAAAAATATEGLDYRIRVDSGSGASCSSREVVGHRDHDQLSSGHVGNSGFSSMDIQHMKHDNFSFAPFRQSFDHEVGIGEQRQTAASAMAREATCEEHEEHERQHRLMQEHHVTHEPQQRRHAAAATAAAAFHITRPTNPISALIPPPPPPPLHQTSMVLEDPFHVSRILLQAQQQQQQQQQGSGAGLEELIMSCSSSGIKGETMIPHSQETAEWQQYSYWLPDNPDHHG